MLGKHLLSTIWLYCRDVPRARAFYRDVLGLPEIGLVGDTAHFDTGTIRLSLHPWEAGPGPIGGSFLVFYIERDLDGVYEELLRRGISFDGPPADAPFGRVAEFRDPDGHPLFLWEPPAKGTPAYDQERILIEHYERLAARLRA